jgi:hypothetical protein
MVHIVIGCAVIRLRSVISSVVIWCVKLSVVFLNGA